MTEIATRVVDEFEELRARHPGGRCVLVSHGDVIKVAVAHYSGVPIDLMQRIEISPGSASIIRLGEWGAQILAVNDTGSLVR
jgi:probable phosphoglycerate mutase